MLVNRISLFNGKKVIIERKVFRKSTHVKKNETRCLESAQQKGEQQVNSSTQTIHRRVTCHGEQWRNISIKLFCKQSFRFAGVISFPRIYFKKNLKYSTHFSKIFVSFIDTVAEFFSFFFTLYLEFFLLCSSVRKFFIISDIFLICNAKVVKTRCCSL